MGTSKTTIKNDYTRLPGTFLATNLGVPRAYLGPNHVLYMRMLGIHEQARRFYYKDITALRCVKTRTGYIVGAVLLVLAILPWGLLLVPGLSPDGALATASVASGVCCLLFLLNAVRGATCATWLHTANHTERIHSLGRYRTARKALARIHERVAAAQRGVAGVEDGDETFTFAPPPQGEAGVATANGGGHAWPAFIVFATSILLAVSFMFDFEYNLDWKNTLDTFGITFMAAMSPVAFVLLRRSGHPGALRIITGVLLAFYATAMTQGVFIGLVLGLSNPAAAVENPEKFGTIAGLTPEDGIIFVVLIGYHTFSILVMGLSGLAGLAALVSKPAGRDAAAASPD